MWSLKYRPRSLDEVLGQEWPLKIIRGALRKEQIPNTWLISGPWGAGKTTVGRILGKALTCLNTTSKGESCNQCEMCKGVPDAAINYREVDAPSFGKADAVRELIQEAQLTPVGGSKFRVILIDEAHTLSQTAQNVLLKTLEEGTGNTIFVLVTTDPQKLLATIKSRSVVVGLEPVEKPLLVELLKKVCEREGVEAEEDAIRLIVNQTHGHARDALTLAEQIALAGPISVEGTKVHLHLDLDEKAAKMLHEAGQDWEEAAEAINIAAQQAPPDALWAAMIRAVVHATAQHQKPEKVAPGKYTRLLIEEYGARLLGVAEWALGPGVKLQVSSEASLLVATSILSQKLGPTGGMAVRRKGKKLGEPAKAKKTDQTSKSLPITSTEAMTRLNMVPIEEPDKAVEKEEETNGQKEKEVPRPTPTLDDFLEGG